MQDYRLYFQNDLFLEVSMICWTSSLRDCKLFEAGRKRLYYQGRGFFNCGNRGTPRSPLHPQSQNRSTLTSIGDTKPQRFEATWHEQRSTLLCNRGDMPFHDQKSMCEGICHMRGREITLSHSESKLALLKWTQLAIASTYLHMPHDTAESASRR